MISRCSAALLLTVVSLSGEAFAATIVSTTFDSDRQDWSTLFPSGTGIGTIWQSTGGNPNGHLEASDRGDGFQAVGAWYFINNVTFNGIRSAAYGGTLTFDLKIFNSGNYTTGIADVKLFGNSLTVVREFSSAPTVGSWNSISIPLIETAGWKLNTLGGATPNQTQFQSLLSQFTGIQIRGDYNDVGVISTFDLTGLDNVALNTPNVVPEPGSLALLGTGILGLVGYRVRRIRSRNRAQATN